MFYSVLFPTEESSRAPRHKEATDAFRDLNLDQILRRLLQDKQHFELDEFFFTPLGDPAVIRYRQEVMRELEDPGIRFAIQGIVGQVSFMRMFLDGLRSKLVENDKFIGKYLDMGHFLENATIFSGVVTGLSENFQRLPLRSEGLKRCAEYVAQYCASEQFRGMQEWAARLRADFDKIRYCLFIKRNNSQVRVMPYEEQESYADQVAELFARFRQGDVLDYRRKLPENPKSEIVENEILNLLAKLYPREFKDLTEFCKANLHFDDDTILQFAREVQFYFSWLDFIEPLKQQGLPFCYPGIHEKIDELKAEDCFDLALALRSEGKVVTNSFSLTSPEQILVVSGPNQGGKTTFARSFGQVHYLSALGVKIPGREAEVFLCDQLLTHFEREEDLQNLSGKLQDDLIRLKQLLDAATPRTVVVVNEIFASTTMQDAMILGRHMIDALVKNGAPAIVVTFLEDLAEYVPQTVSMVTTVSDDDRHKRTFRILRKKPDGLAYAMQIAARHGLTYEQLERRLQA